MKNSFKSNLSQATALAPPQKFSQVFHFHTPLGNFFREPAFSRLKPFPFGSLALKALMPQKAAIFPEKNFFSGGVFMKRKLDMQNFSDAALARALSKAVSKEELSDEEIALIKMEVYDNGD